jgi:ribosomal peptide maturation radical SAM protein 1
MDRVLLVNMPFYSIEHPSIGLGLLKAELNKENIPCDILYLNLTFAELLSRGCENTHDILKSIKLYHDIGRRFLLFGDWLFSHDLFNNNRREESCSIKQVLQTVKQYWHKPWGNLDTELLQLTPEISRVRDLVQPFLDKCLQSVDWDNYAIVGFSIINQQQVPSLALAKRIKTIYPKKIIVFGGANGEDVMGEALIRLFPFVDCICSGKADTIFIHLVKRLLSGKPIDNIPNIIYRKGDQRLLTIDRHAVSIDLDSLPYPDYDDYFQQLNRTLLNRFVDPYLLFETSRGCWWGEKSHCTFCGLNSGDLNYNSKSAQRAIGELSYLKRRYNTSTFVAVDNILDMSYFKDFIPDLKKSQLNLQIHYETRASLSKKKLRQLKEAGICEIRPGIESLSTPILKLVKKGTTALQNIQLLKWAREVGLWAGWTFLVGLPGEDPEEYRRMAEIVRTITHLQAPLDLCLVRVDRFSPYFTKPEKYGLCRIRPLEIYRHIFPFDGSNLYQLAYFFDYDHIDDRNPVTYLQPLIEAVKNWKQIKNASLTCRAQGEKLVIQDERPGRKHPSFLLTGIQKAIYEYCDQVRSLSAIEAKINALAKLQSETGLPICSLEKCQTNRELCEDQAGFKTQKHPERRYNKRKLKFLIEELVDLKLMLEDDDKYLSLAVMA